MLSQIILSIIFVALLVSAGISFFYAAIPVLMLDALALYVGVNNG